MGDLTDEISDVIMLHDGTLLRTHGRVLCRGRTCSIHNPSDHPLKAAPQHWRSDRGLMERICPHGVGHPDFDHVTFVRITYGADAAWAAGIHGCCEAGCCAEPR